MATNYWDLSSVNSSRFANTTISTSGTTNIGYGSEYYQQLAYVQPQTVWIDDKKVTPKVKKAIYNFPFKKNSYKGLSDQLQGEFDAWIGNTRKELFSEGY